MALNDRALIFTNEPKSWLKKAYKNERFTILIFYRGQWCTGCQTYLQQITPIVPEIKKAGGQIFGICAQDRTAVNDTREEWQLNYELVPDPKNILVKKYGMGILKQTSKKWKRLVEMITKVKNCEPELPVYDAGVAMPGVLVLKQDGTVLYKWVAEAKETNFMGGYKRVNPSDVLKIVDFYFKNSSILESVQQATINNRTDIMDALLNDANAKKAFKEHLKKEYNEEALEFIEDVAQLQKCNTTDPIAVYDTYIPTTAPKAVNIPGSIRRGVADMYKTKGYEAFVPAKEHVKFCLGEDAFNRFVKTEEFLELAPQFIPQCFTSESTEDVCVLSK
jgi:peroxiredoxin